MRLLLLLSLAIAATGTQLYDAPADVGVTGQYIVVLKEGENLDNIIDRLMTAANSQKISALVKRRYRTVINGFVVQLDDDINGRQMLLSLSGVEYVEQDKMIHKDLVVGSWGIDRIDQRDNELNNDMTLDGYGEGVHIYVIDTGINPDHVDFGGRAIAIKDFVDEDGTAIDCDGHGTHCAGTTASNTYGIAREATVYGVRILDCFGSGLISSSVAAMDWIATEGKRPAVASMSYGGFFSPTEFQAANRAKQLGVVLVTSAGNSNADACLQSPAGSPDVITVGSTDRDDVRSSFSNYGRCVQLFAPGSSIISLAHDSNDGTRTYSGTSMACPHVAGIAAVLLGQGYSAQQVYDKIISSATLGVVTNPNAAPNLLAYCS
ncbi:alkaline serine exoprotease A-like [Diadema setosum]|uniref:alkaline serine exoprotease A-like n=1 Tax=Diadema setosum TaxID=31175 RepID=UPI003B3AC216